MKAPDKIHLFFSSDGDYLAFKEKPFEGTVAYIRKDALLEWISEARAIPREYATIRDLAFQEVVNYLNTM